MLKERKAPRVCAFTRDSLKLTAGVCTCSRSFMLSDGHACLRVHACKRPAECAPVHARVRARPYLQLEQLDREIDLLNEHRLEVDL